MTKGKKKEVENKEAEAKIIEATKEMKPFQVHVYEVSAKSIVNVQAKNMEEATKLAEEAVKAGRSGSLLPSDRSRLTITYNVVPADQTLQ